MTATRTAAPTLADRLVLPFLLSFALLLRVREALRAPLWYDELYSQAAVHRSWDGVMQVMRADVHPPMHFVLAHFWRFFGESDLAIRSLSLLFGLGALTLAWVLTRELFGRSAAAIATLLLVLHPWHVYVSQEARSYPILWFFLAASALGAWRWSEYGGKRDAFLFVIASALALWTHYLAGVVLFVQCLWGLARFAREPKRALAWLGLHVGIGVLFAPLVPMLWQQFHRVEGDHWMPRPGVSDLIDFARRVGFSAIYLAPLVVLLAAYAFVPEKQRRAAGFALAIGPLTVLLCWVLGMKGIRLFAVKYMLFALTPIFALVAGGIVRLPGRFTPFVSAALLSVLALRAELKREPYPEAAGLAGAKAVLDGHVHAGDTIFHADSHTLLFGEHYYPQARHRLLLMGQRFPYFEGGHLIADSLRGDASEVGAAQTSGARWFAMAAAPAGLDTHAAASVFDSLAGAPQRLGVVRVWSSAATR